jgi:hypothetical protein
VQGRVCPEQAGHRTKASHFALHPGNGCCIPLDLGSPVRLLIRGRVIYQPTTHRLKGFVSASRRVGPAIFAIRSTDRGQARLTGYRAIGPDT